MIINPQSYDTIYALGILHTHISNFEHALATDVDFDRIVLISSNEMFVKHGISDYVSKFTFGAQTELFDTTADWHSFKTEILENFGMAGFLKSLGLPVFFGGQAEGQFFDKNTFSLISRLYTAFFPMGPCGFISEEIIPATVAARLCMSGTTAALPITLCDYCTNVSISDEIISQIRNGAGRIFARKVPRNLRSPHFGVSALNGVFSVKRVPREDCDLRRYIRGLMHEPDRPQPLAAGN